MNISINKDIEKYQESVVMGLTARQLIFSIASIAAIASCGCLFNCNIITKNYFIKLKRNHLPPISDQRYMKNDPKPRKSTH